MLASEQTVCQRRMAYGVLSKISIMVASNLEQGHVVRRNNYYSTVWENKWELEGPLENGVHLSVKVELSHITHSDRRKHHEWESMSENSRRRAIRTYMYCTYANLRAGVSSKMMLRTVSKCWIPGRKSLKTTCMFNIYYWPEVKHFGSLNCRYHSRILS